MAVEAQAAPQTGRVSRPRRERDQEVLVWPDLVFIEFIAAVVFTITFVVLSAVLDAPLLDRANLSETPNPSKAPWYFMNLQELLLHMHPALAGVIVPTIALVLLAALPFVDTSHEGQGLYFNTPNAVKITLFSVAFASVFVTGLILYDQGRHVNVTTNIVQRFDKDWEWPAELAPFQNVRSIQTGWEWGIPVPKSTQLGGGEHDGELNWPEDFQHVPMPFNGTSGPEWMRWGPPSALPGWMQALYWYDLNMNFPAFLVEQLIPVALMVGLPVLMIFILRRMGLVLTVHDGAIALFSAFMTSFLILTIIGAGFRGAGQDLVLPWDVPSLE
jgi:quinol---cytochrome c reductase cytochrome c subunit, bacillus type